MDTTGEDVKRMIQEIGTTIQRTLSESPQIGHCLNRIRAEGYEVSVVLEATIGFSKSGKAEGSSTEVASFDFRVERPEPVPPKMTPLDKKFLRSLKITVEEEE